MPARDEAQNLARLLPSVALAPVEVVVVDDQSGDATADVARDHGVRVVATDGPPDGWTGKAWACATGARAATGQVLVFLDADVVVEPGGLERIVGEQQRDSRGLVSVQPWHDVVRPYEQLSAFFNLIAPMAIDAFTPLGRRIPPRGAFGPCLVLDRDLYDRIGGHGHERVRGAVLDDVEMAKAVRAAGAPVRVFGGRGALRFRMYPHGMGQLIEGWTKNFAGGAAATRPLTSLLVLAWMSGLIAAPTIHVGLYLAYALQLVVLFRRVGRFSPVTALLYPIPLAFFVAVFLRSVVLTFIRREVTWRGRSIRT